jgi:hypothetical protein
MASYRVQIDSFRRPGGWVAAWLGGWLNAKLGEFGALEYLSVCRAE